MDTAPGADGVPISPTKKEIMVQEPTLYTCTNPECSWTGNTNMRVKSLNNMPICPVCWDKAAPTGEYRNESMVDRNSGFPCRPDIQREEVKDVFRNLDNNKRVLDVQDIQPRSL